MLSFLGWLTILHFGPNSNIYPFFRFENPDKNDPYTYRLTVTASLCIWTIELVSSFLARGLCWLIHRVHVTDVSGGRGVPDYIQTNQCCSSLKVGLSEFRNYPELVPACIITSIHVLSDMLLVSHPVLCMRTHVIKSKISPFDLCASIWHDMSNNQFLLKLNFRWILHLLHLITCCAYPNFSL